MLKIASKRSIFDIPQYYWSFWRLY